MRESCILETVASLSPERPLTTHSLPFRRGKAVRNSGPAATAHTQTFRLTIRAPINRHSLTAIFPFLRLRRAISGKGNREQILGNRISRTAGGAITKATVPLWVPNREGCAGPDQDS